MAKRVKCKNAFAILACWWLSGCHLAETLWQGESSHIGPSGCVQLTPENALHPVGACEKTDTYDFLVLQDTYSYGKTEFRGRLRDQILTVLRRTAFPAAGAGDAWIDVWMVSPVFAPDEAHLVAVGRGVREHHFALKLPLSMDRWEVRADDLLLLGNDSFPSPAAKRAGFVLVETQPYAQVAALTSWLRDVGFAEPVPSTSVMMLATRPFAEASFAGALRQHPAARHLLRQVHYVPAGHTAGAKAKLFSFPLVDKSSSQGIAAP